MSINVYYSDIGAFYRVHWFSRHPVQHLYVVIVIILTIDFVPTIFYPSHIMSKITTAKHYGVRAYWYLSIVLLTYVFPD